jgi:hypothetical protein
VRCLSASPYPGVYGVSARFETIPNDRQIPFKFGAAPCAEHFNGHRSYPPVKMIRAALKACREMQFEIDRSAMAKFLID